MNRSLRYALLVALLLTLTGCVPRTTRAPQTVLQGERSVLFLAINDVYRIEGVDAGTAGGLPRVRQLRIELEEQDPDLLMVHAGDFLFPSLLSRQFAGEQMVDILNRLDGDAGAFDERFFITFGNHEFDKEKADDAEMVDRRVEESEFTWFDTNIGWKLNEAGQPAVAAEQMVQHRIVDSGGVRVGLFSLSTNLKHPAYVEQFGDPLAVARRETADLRLAGAELVVALTHLPLGQDVELLQRLGAAGPDLIIGGHEHNRLCRRVDVLGAVKTCPAEPGQVVVASTDLARLVIKADAEARTAAVVRVTLPEDGAPRVRVEYRNLDTGVSKEEEVQEVVDQWLVRHDEEYCRENFDKPPGCLAQRLGSTKVRLVGEELAIRRYESNLGDWVVDQALASYVDQGVVAAFINSGSLRLNQDIPPGDVTLRHVEEIFQFPSVLRVLELRGADLQAVINHAITDWTGNGRWLQIAGFAFRHDPASSTADRLTLLTADGPRAILPDEILRVVTTNFLADPRTGQDGYTMLTREMWVEEAADGALNLKQLMVRGLETAGDQGIAPQIEGRICSTDRPGPCLAVGSGAKAVEAVLEAAMRRRREGGVRHHLSGYRLEPGTGLPYCLPCRLP